MPLVFGPTVRCDSSVLVCGLRIQLLASSLASSFVCTSISTAVGALFTPHRPKQKCSHGLAQTSEFESEKLEARRSRRSCGLLRFIWLRGAKLNFMDLLKIERTWTAAKGGKMLGWAASARLPVCERGLFGKQIDELRQEELPRPQDRSGIGQNGCIDESWIQNDILLFIVQAKPHLCLENLRLPRDRCILHFVCLVFGLACLKFLVFCLWKRVRSTTAAILRRKN